MDDKELKQGVDAERNESLAPNEIPLDDRLIVEEKEETQSAKRSFGPIQIVGVVLIITGILLFALPFFNSYLIKKNSELNLSALTYKEISQNRVNSVINLNQVINGVYANPIEEIVLFNVWGFLNKYHNDQLVGQLVIPALSIDLAIFNQMNDENLMAGVSEMKMNERPGEGNYTLSGHRAKGRNVLLNRLMDAQKGMRINITDKEKVYVYKVVNTMTVSPSAVDLVADYQTANYESKPIVSIMTCNFGKSTQRFFVVGQLVKTLPYSEDALRASTLD